MRSTKGFTIIFLVLFLLIFNSFLSSALQLRTLERGAESLGTPELEFGIVNCWFDRVEDKIRIHGTVINTGNNFKTDGCHVIFFKEGTESMCGICKIPRFDLFSPGVWKNGEIYSFECYIGADLDLVEARIDYYNVVPESNEENNVDVFPVCPDVVVSGFIYGREDEALDKVDVGYYDIYYERFSAGLLVYTDDNGFYEISLPAKKPFNEKHTYVLEVGNTKEGYNYQEKETPDVEAGGSIVLDFKLDSKAKIIISPFFIQNT